MCRACALNHEMVRAVLTERQTSDCDVKCPLKREWERLYFTGPQNMAPNYMSSVARNAHYL